MLNIIDIINKKSSHQSLTKEEIYFAINQYVEDKIEDYQMSALLMAIKILDLNDEELGYFTQAMIDSGETLDFHEIEGVVVDKHSTGGVGDKVTLALVPLLAACGLKVAKMSGRGLGHTGGTLDKLESIPGYNVFLNEKDFLKQVNELGLAIIGQIEGIVPADKKLYALRDVSGTVGSTALIASSVISKKLALGADAILLDIKVGKGAFMKDLGSATTLAKRMLKIARRLNRKVEIELSNMDQPLGNMIGNKMEVLEALDFLKNQSKGEFHDLVVSSASKLLMMTKKVQNKEEAFNLIMEALLSLNAYKKFVQMAVAQGVKESFFEEEIKKWWEPKFEHQIVSKKGGYFFIKNAKTFGLVAVELGAGRHKMSDKLDYNAGIQLFVKNNQNVKANEHIISLYSDSPIDKEVINSLYDGFEIRKEKTKIKLLYDFKE